MKKKEYGDRDNTSLVYSPGLGKIILILIINCTISDDMLLCGDMLLRDDMLLCNVKFYLCGG